jgi:hypothetical protein
MCWFKHLPFFGGVGRLIGFVPTGFDASHLTRATHGCHEEIYASVVAVRAVRFDGDRA